MKNELTFTGVFIPDDIKDLKLSLYDRYVLSFYKFCSVGKFGCCTLSLKDTAEYLNISTTSLKRAKNNLKDIGFIRVEGRRVYFCGLSTDQVDENSKRDQNGLKRDLLGPVDESTERDLLGLKRDLLGPVDESTERDLLGPKTRPIRSNLEQKRDLLGPDYIKKNIKKEKEEGCGEMEEQKTNFERLVAMLPDEQRTEECIEYLKEKLGEERIKNFNKRVMSDGEFIPVKEQVSSIIWELLRKKAAEQQKKLLQEAMKEKYGFLI